MAHTTTKPRIAWYRSPVDKDQLRQLNQRSDLLGFAQTGGFLGLLALTGAAAWYSASHLPWPVTVAIIFFHGMCWNFMINGFHELVHDSVFKTRWLNAFFLRIFSFLGWYNHIHFWASHTEHHKYTLHPPDDLEVVLPQKFTRAGFFKTAIINPIGLRWSLQGTIRHAMGKLEGQWEHTIFPDSNPQLRQRMFRWARILLVGHAIILGVSIYMQWWLLPILVTLAPFYGSWLHFFCNASQHVGLADNVPDFRLCCRTIILNPFFRFLYWHMNYHTEHHMYAAVPCYKLGRLHKLIKNDLPPCPRGLYATWTQIADILEKQKHDPAYQYRAPLPTPGNVSSQDDSDDSQSASDTATSATPTTAT